MNNNPQGPINGGDGEPEEERSWLSEQFDAAADTFLKVWNNPFFEGGMVAGSTALFASSLLLGTTFLSSPAILAGVALVSLIKTSEIVSKKAESIGLRLGMSPLMIGIGLGMITSLPELAVSAAGMLNGLPEVALGNGIGSNIANVGLILGVSAIMKPLRTSSTNWVYDASVMGLSTAFIMGNMALSHLGMFSGITMIGMLSAYFGGQYLLEKRRQNDAAADDAPDAASQNEQPEGKAEEIHMGRSVPHETPEARNNSSMLKDALWGASGIAGLIGSASLLVSGGSAVALSMGVPASVVAMFGFAIGTSLPELSVSLQAVFRGNTALAIGNILGSNIFNNLFVIGFNNAASAIFGEGIKVPAAFGWDNAMGRINNIAYGLSAALPISFLTYNKLRNGENGITRKQGVLMAASYAAFAGLTYALGGGAPEQVAAASAASTVPAPVPA